MDKSKTHLQIALTFLYGIGPKKTSLLLSKLGSLEAVFETKYKDIQEITGIGETVIKKIKRESALKKAEEQLHFIEKNKINTHFYLDNNYPRRLKQCDDAPILLYSKGDFDPNPARVISIVGTRSATDYGKSICEELVTTLAKTDIQIVSGMAYGIDICAHQLCVKHNVQTIGVLGHGLDRIYPSVHQFTAEQMFLNGGLMTEFIPGTNPDRENFPMRNRIVAGMADATIVVESKKNGGSLITANLANDYNRDVFAFPGNVGQLHSAGCNLLIQKQQAHLLMNGNDFLKQMNWDNLKEKNSGAQRVCFIELSDQEKEICAVLDKSNGEHIDVISLRMKKPVSIINVELFHLEMKGVIKALPGKKYCLI
ncbi:MAG: DNA-protecting protein DprA [Bacteroidota bacterium]